MEHTQNYNLPQWAKTDRIMMEDFNAAMTSIESGIDLARSETSALSTRVDGVALEAAKLPYAVGSYTGNGAGVRDFTLGFRPRFVIICDDQRSYTESAPARVLVAGPAQSSLGRLTMTDTGFRVSDNSDTTNLYPKGNASGHTYDYIAFR